MYNPGAPPPAYSSEWQCYRCTLLNAQSATVCAACQTRKPEDDHIPPPPPDEPPAFQAPMSQVQVQAGVPQGCMQVICPNCRILIALPPGMPRFLCPRCRTECMAPPMHHFVPQYQPLQPQQHMAPPPQQSMGMGVGAGNPNNVRRSPQHQPAPQQAPLPGSVSPTNRAGSGASHASGYHPVGGVQEVKDSGSAVGGSHLSPDSAQGRALNAAGGNANTVQGMNETRLSGMNWPRGTCSLSVRAFILAQCPLLNFYWLYFMCCTNRSVKDKTRYQFEWYDTNAAKSGFTAGFLVFLGWLILYIAVGAKNHMHGYAILGSLLAVFFGPLILVVICWELACWNRQCNAPPNCNIFDCGDCGGCCAGDCCECRALNRCCGRCDCGGCDCGGCDC